MLAAWWYLLRGKSQKSNVEGTTLFSSCLPHAPPVNSPKTSEIQANCQPESPIGEKLRSVLLNLDIASLRQAIDSQMKEIEAMPAALLRSAFQARL